MRRKDLQQTYTRDEAAFQQALTMLDAAKEESGEDALADLPELPELPSEGEEHVVSP